MLGVARHVLHVVPTKFALQREDLCSSGCKRQTRLWKRRIAARTCFGSNASANQKLTSQTKQFGWRTNSPCGTFALHWKLVAGHVPARLLQFNPPKNRFRPSLPLTTTQWHHTNNPHEQTQKQSVNMNTFIYVLDLPAFIPCMVHCRRIHRTVASTCT